jgi:hypothetical protein
MTGRIRNWIESGIERNIQRTQDAILHLNIRYYLCKTPHRARQTSNRRPYGWKLSCVQWDLTCGDFRSYPCWQWIPAICSIDDIKWWYNAICHVLKTVEHRRCFRHSIGDIQMSHTTFLHQRPTNPLQIVEVQELLELLLSHQEEPDPALTWSEDILTSSVTFLRPSRNISNLSVALQPFVGPSPPFQFLALLHIR